MRNPPISPGPLSGLSGRGTIGVESIWAGGKRRRRRREGEERDDYSNTNDLFRA